MENIVFATMATPASLTQTMMLLDSLRTFGGELANSPCIMLTPKSVSLFSHATEERLNAINIRPVPLDLTDEARQFPLASIVYAASAAEEQVRGRARILVWMSENTLVINPPAAFLLPKKINYAYRPVHHTRIGSVYEKPLDGFWSLIYQHCGVAEDKVFPMETCTRDNTLRAYFNADLLSFIYRCKIKMGGQNEKTSLRI